VGGGTVATRKIRSLLQSGARLTVVSPEVSSFIARRIEQGRMVGRIRRYRRGDLRGAFVVVAATDNPELNVRIAREAPALVNVVDAPEWSNFIVPAVCNRGDLLISVSTSGTSPALAAAIRRELEERYGPEFSHFLRKTKKERERILAEIDDPGQRRRLLKRLGSDTQLGEIRRNKGS